MTADLRLLAYSVLLTWLMLLTASSLRTRYWTLPGAALALGNRDNLTQGSPVAGRAERAARNMLENLVLFAALLLAGHMAGVNGSRLELGAQLFFWARVAYFPIYLAGIHYLRTAAWAVGVAGLGVLFAALV